LIGLSPVINLFIFQRIISENGTRRQNENGNKPKINFKLSVEGDKGHSYVQWRNERKIWDCKRSRGQMLDR